MGEVKYTYKDNNLYDSFGHAIMMEWESDWMEASADIVCKNNGDILNIGFGLGLVDSFIQKHNPKSHTIIECHNDVLNHMKENGWYNRANIIEDKWQNVIKKLPKFDGIYFDTWSDSKTDDFPFGMLKYLNNILKVGGVFSFWNNTNTETDVKKYLPKNFKIEHKQFKVNVPKKQHLNINKNYISPELKYVQLPIITKKYEGEIIEETMI